MPNDLPEPIALDASQRAVLRALLETLVPASEARAMPSAAEVDFEAYLGAQARDFAPELRATLGVLGEAFAAASPDARHARVAELAGTEPAKFAALLARVYDCYYQDDRVRARIGVVRGPVFPQGNEVKQGDLSLLDPVIENAALHRYRVP